MRARFARHALKHLPGVAAIIAKNMPAASGLAAANALYNSSDREGGTIAALTNGVAMEPLFGNQGARYDALRLNWLGSIGKLENVCAPGSAVRRKASKRHESGK